MIWHKRPLLYVLVISLITFSSSYAQLTVNAGPDKTICPGMSTTIGSIAPASGGLAPYTYSWSPSTFLSSTTVPNPICTPGPLTYNTYTLKVTDDTGAVAYDAVGVGFYNVGYSSAGADTSICENESAQLGVPLNFGGGLSFTWLPATYLDNSTSPRPTTISPLTSMSYTMTVTSASCPPFTDVVNVTVIPTPAIDAGPDVTIYEGEVTTLNATGGFFYAWSPPPVLYEFTYNPDVEPNTTTTYYLYGTDISNTCPGYDSVVVTVLPSDELVFYNTFTPNSDGNNDTWFIGNIQKYPNNRLEIYNRNGKLVYKATSYLNTWDGKAFGQDLPEGTYYYVLDLGDGKGKKNGTVTIIN